jgi:hypothetical protein
MVSMSPMSRLRANIHTLERQKWEEDTWLRFRLQLLGSSYRDAGEPRYDLLASADAKCGTVRKHLVYQSPQFAANLLCETTDAKHSIK